MSDNTIRYDDIHLYAERGASNSMAFKSWLEDNNVPFAALEYNSDVVEAALEPLRTWVFDNHKESVNFSEMPILIYKELLWESPDKVDRFDKIYYALSTDDLPSDFISKVS